MSFTQDDIDALEAAAKKGLKTVSYDGQSVTYASISEMNEQINRMKRAVQKRARARYPSVDRGT